MELFVKTYKFLDEVLINRSYMATSEFLGKGDDFVVDEPSEGRVVLDDDEDAAPFRQVEIFTELILLNIMFFQLENCWLRIT